MQKIAIFCCLGRIRTLTGGTRIRRATITPQGNGLVITGAKLCTFFDMTKFLGDFFRKAQNFISFPGSVEYMEYFS